jgi:hypothetical protein
MLALVAGIHVCLPNGSKTWNMRDKPDHDWCGESSQAPSVCHDSHVQRVLWNGIQFRLSFALLCIYSHARIRLALCPGF